MKFRWSALIFALLCLARVTQSTVFGLEFTATGIICSASLPNDTIVPLTSVYGGDEYVAVMHRMYTEAKNGGASELRTQENIDLHRPSAFWDFGWLALPTATAAPPVDSFQEATTILSKAVTRAKKSCLRSLVVAHNVHETELHPRAIVAAPNFIYTPPKRRLVETNPTWWITHWKYLGPTPNDWKAWQAKQIDMMMRAAKLGGFDSGEVEVYPAAELVSFGRDPPHSEAIVIEFSAYGVSLWKSGENKFFHSFPASYWKEAVSKGLREHRQRGSSGITLAGSGWTSWRLRSLYHLVSDSGLEIAAQNSRGPIFAASRGAAKHAIRTESVLS